MFIHRPVCDANCTDTGHSDHKMMEFSILGEVRRGVSRTATLDFRRVDFALFRMLV